MNSQHVSALQLYRSKVKIRLFVRKTSKLYQLEKQLGDKVSDSNEPAVQDFNMKISMDGTWYYQGTPINRIALVKLFASVLNKDRNGIYWLVTPVEQELLRLKTHHF